MATPKLQTVETSNTPSPWLFNPWLDLVVGCGAWSIPLLLISYSSIAASTRVWAIAFYALALVFNYPHYMATIYRAYHRAEDFQKYRMFTVHTTALVFITLLLSHFRPGMLPWIFTIYLTWSPWHYSGQNYGLFMMFARRAGATPTQPERAALYGAFITSYLILFLTFHTGASSDPLFISLGIPAAAGRWGQIALGFTFVTLSIYGISQLLQAVGWRKLTPCLTLFSSQFVWFLLPAVIALVKGAAIPQSRYSTGVLAVMHSAQYLWITSYYARREAKEVTSRNWRPFAYFGVLVAGGIALFVPGPWLASRVFHHDFTASFLIFTALVNIHHFILDGAIWKLRDGRVASLLLNSRARIANAASEAGGGMSQAWSWISGSTAGAHWIRISAAVLLLTWGTIDQARYYLALRSDNVLDLQRAESLDSFDSNLQTRLAHRELEDGHPQKAEVAWRKAMQANPADPAPRLALLRFLIEHNRFDEAYDLSNSSLAYLPKSAGMWMDHGLLAQRRGDSAQALESWSRAIAIDPGETQAHLYMANELDHEGKPEAVAHYKAYLSAIAREPATKRPSPEKVIAIVLRLADCQARAAQAADAIQSYQLAAKIAAQTNQIKLESVANVNEAAIQSQSGQPAPALKLYQHALELDESIGDRTASAEDWLSYGRFLQNAGYPPRLAYACFLKAFSLADFLPDASQRLLLTDARQQTEKQIGKAATAIRRDPEPVLQEAIQLRP